MGHSNQVLLQRQSSSNSSSSQSRKRNESSPLDLSAAKTHDAVENDREQSVALDASELPKKQLLKHPKDSKARRSVSNSSSSSSLKDDPDDEEHIETSY
mmetsp:Transcript_70228/g.111689  ORF Transcript_70228/g.111689 Transcript_70228/m.111689 type:complete len:99 (-) Transcript_70228:62-358(-)